MRSKRAYDLIGRRFGRLIVIDIDTLNENKHEKHWICLCDCGKSKTVTTGHLTHGTVTSCGCLRKEQAIARFKEAARNNIKHGESANRTSLYGVWHVMKQRCENPNNPAYKWYGGKGVKVCEGWKEYAEFAKWAHANGYKELRDVPRPQKLSIDRIDSNGDYCPENCRWITIHENSLRATKARWEKYKRTNGSTRTA